MPRSGVLFLASFALAAAAGAALETATQAGAETPVPLLNAAMLGSPLPHPASPAWGEHKAYPPGPVPAPGWRNTSWLNTDHPLTLDELRGRVVLLNFWVFTCWNCTNTVPSLVDFDHKYRGRGLTIVGIHTPEFPPYAGEHDKGNVERALREYGIEYPNAQDNDSRTWNLYHIRYWPSFVLIDKRGNIRYEGYGEFHLNDGSYDTWDRRIQELLAE